MNYRGEIGGDANPGQMTSTAAAMAHQAYGALASSMFIDSAASQTLLETNVRVEFDGNSTEECDRGN